MRVLLATVLLLLTGCGRPGSPALAYLHPCHLADGPTDAYCGTVRVFEDRLRQSGRTIDLKVVVAPALRRDARPDPLFVFEGGPGGGAATLAFERIPMFRRFEVDRDIVLVDQRGTGASNPLDCAPDEPDDDDVRTLDDYPVERYRTCLERLHADPRHYTTAVAMDDIEDVRRVLGYGPINLWGGSYGTRAALVYLQRHEASVRSVVLDGVAPTDMRLPLYMARDSQRALDRLLDACAHDTACAQRYPDLRATLARLWTRLADRPTVELAHPRTGRLITVTITARIVAAVIFQALYSPELSALLPQLMTDAAEGRYQGVLALAMSRSLPKGAMSEGMFLSVVCAEDLPRITPADIARETAGSFLGTTLFDTQMQPCAFWPRGSVAGDYYAPVTSDRPVLLFSGENDPVTPPSWADYVAQHLPRAKHLVVPGAGHITLTRGCVPHLVGRFLETADPGAVDGACLGQLSRPPFFTSLAGPVQP